LYKDLTSVTRWQRISSHWGRFGLSSEALCSNSQQEPFPYFQKRANPTALRAGRCSRVLHADSWLHQSKRWQGASLITNSFRTLLRSVKKLNFAIHLSGFIPRIVLRTGQVNLTVSDDYPFQLNLDLEQPSLAAQGCLVLSQDFKEAEKSPKWERSQLYSHLRLSLPGELFATALSAKRPTSLLTESAHIPALSQAPSVQTSREQSITVIPSHQSTSSSHVL